MSVKVSYHCNHCDKDLPVYKRGATYVTVGGVSLSGKIEAHVDEKHSYASTSSFLATFEPGPTYGVDTPSNDKPRFCSVACLRAVFAKWIDGIQERLSAGDVVLNPPETAKPR